MTKSQVVGVVGGDKKYMTYTKGDAFSRSAYQLNWLRTESRDYESLRMIRLVASGMIGGRKVMSIYGMIVI